ncbi:hypothetical protein MATL_G00167080 [Megalops atlanticus]|uniref:RPA-related protein RADX-like n=1 Tax=Megalops atlanticus TaxID=7932 RepID=A0A9D3PS92_MEGAT|nr:hypothetical protein MATL_G00167080 [Megalops atlanticus]
MATTVARRAGCILQRTISWPDGGHPRSESAKTCREPLYLISLDRYGKDLGFGIFFPEAIHASDSLYDATVSDGDCRLRVTIHPSLNPLVERNDLRCGCQLRNVTFSSVAEADDGTDGDGCPAYRVVSLEVDADAGGDAGLEAFCGIDLDALPWFGLQGDDQPSPLPLRAQRSSYLPLWNNQDYRGEMWRDTPPPGGGGGSSESDSGEGTEDLQPTVTLQEVRQGFLSRSRVIRGVLVVQILQKSRLFYYGRAERNCKSPYKAILEVADWSGRATVVLWNSVCMDWYRCVHPGVVLRLARYRVKESYNSRMGENEQDDIEISLNSRNPSANISVIPRKDVLSQWRLPRPSYTFYSGKDILSCPLGATCDVIGLVVFVGRAERTRRKDSQGMELWEYRWLRLEDGTTNQPILVKLFSTSQPEIHSVIHPLSILVCTNLQLVRTAPDRPSSFQYLTNTSLTQVYCTGSGHHSTMPYRRLHPVRQFIQWLQTVDENQVLHRAVIGGFFSYPPLPVSLERYMKNRKGEPGLVSGAELRREAEKLQYRESRMFAIQATITAVSYTVAGEEEGSLSLSTVPAGPIPSTPCSPDHGGASIIGSSPPSSITLSPRSPRLRAGLGLAGSSRSAKRRLFHNAEPPRKRLALPLCSAQQADLEEDRDFSLWEASMEFLERNEDEDETDSDDDEDDETLSFVTAATSPLSPRRSQLGVVRAAGETLPRQFCPQRRVVQAAAMGLQPGRLQETLPERKLDTFALADCYSGHYTLSLRALTDGILINTLFLPASPGNLHWIPHPHPHSNSWEAILSHGGFSPSTPPPAPSDLIAMATQMTSQRLVCVLEVCQLGGGRMEVVLSRAFPLRD